MHLVMLQMLQVMLHDHRLWPFPIANFTLPFPIGLEPEGC